MANAITLVVLEPPLRAAVNRIARQHRVSISSVCRELIREALRRGLKEDRKQRAGWSRPEPE